MERGENFVAHKYASLVTTFGSLFEDSVVWIKMEGIEVGNLGIACVYAPNILTNRMHLWHLITNNLPKDCDWIVGGDFNKTERPNDKSNDYRRTITDLKNLVGMGFLMHFKYKTPFFIKGGLDAHGIMEKRLEQDV